MTENAERPLRDFAVPLYHPLLPELFDQPLAPERHATCDQCAMQPPSHEAAGGTIGTDKNYFGSAKCCTFEPDLPNFHLGALLLDADPAWDEGRRRLRERIASRVALTPLGAHAPPRYNLLYRSSRAFGKAMSMVCSYFEHESGGCTIWPFREAVAVTYHCKYNDGEDGWALWMALKRYLKLLERVLSRHALLELGWPAGAFELEQKTGSEAKFLDAHDLDETVDAARYEEEWRGWSGREEELFGRCHEIVSALDASEVQRLGGVFLEIARRQVEECYRAVRSVELPERLKLNPMLRAERSNDGSWLLTSYSTADPLVVSSKVFGTLRHIDPWLSLAENLERIEEECRVRLSRGLLTALLRHRVLIEQKS